MSTHTPEGELEIDHRASPGVTGEQLIATGYEPELALQATAGKGQMFRVPGYTCSHCTKTVIINPKRTRPHEHCPKCHHDICSTCSALRALGHPCIPAKKVFDVLQNRALRGDPDIIPPDIAMSPLLVDRIMR